MLSALLDADPRALTVAIHRQRDPCSTVAALKRRVSE
jgi:hypothetical protein